MCPPVCPNEVRYHHPATNANQGRTQKQAENLAISGLFL
jgi:hypothetical protein